MNTEPCCKNIRLGAYAVGLIGTFVIVAFLVHLMQSYTETPSVSANRSTERLQIKAEFDAANNPLVEKYDWQDQPKGIVRIPLERAKELVLEEWKNPEVAHSNLMARAAKAFAPAPKPPEKKNEYE